MLVVAQCAKVKPVEAKLIHEKYLNNLDTMSRGHDMLGMVESQVFCILEQWSRLCNYQLNILKMKGIQNFYRKLL